MELDVMSKNLDVSTIELDVMSNTLDISTIDLMSYPKNLVMAFHSTVETSKHLDVTSEVTMSHPNTLDASPKSPASPPAGAAYFLLSEDSLRNLALVGALPSQAIKYIRVHWLLELVRASAHGCQQDAAQDPVHSAAPPANCISKHSAGHNADNDIQYDIHQDTNHGIDQDINYGVGHASHHDVGPDAGHGTHRDANCDTCRETESNIVQSETRSSHSSKSVSAPCLEFDFSALDRLLDWLVERRLTPHVELMGNPAGAFHNLSRPAEARAWRHFVARLVLRFIERYGVEEVANWRFETWNEPDLRMFNTLNFTVKGFMRYVRASSAGLRDAWSAAGAGKPRPLLLGPAGLFKESLSHRICWALVRACNRRPRLCPIDVLSFHRKGGGAFGEGVVLGGVNLLHRLYARFPQLRPLPVANTEADPQVGWARPQPWRADTRYAADVVRIAVLSQRHLVHGMGANLLVSSNDNAFLSFYPHQFDQRTLLARFQMNRTHPRHTQFFQKPVYAVLALLGLLGHHEVELQGSGVSGLAVLATVDAADPTRRTYAALVLASGGPGHGSSVSGTVLIALRNMLPDTMLAAWVVDSSTDPAHLWQQQNSPAYPSAKLRAAMRNVQGPRLAFGKPTSHGGLFKLAVASGLITSGNVSTGPSPALSLDVTMPSSGSVVLVQVCQVRPESPPASPSRLIAFNVTAGEMLLLWSDENITTKCILEYVVEKDEQRISPSALRLLSFQYTPGKTSGLNISGVYTVHACDLWGRSGARSEPLHYIDPHFL